MTATHTSPAGPANSDPITRALLEAAPRVDTPERNYRVSRCCGAFAWKGVARPACPVCGGTLSTTTRMLKAQFTILEGELLTFCERLPGGLAGEAKWHRDRAADAFRHVREVEAGLESGAYVEADGQLFRRREVYDWEVENGRVAHGAELERGQLLLAGAMVRDACESLASMRARAERVAAEHAAKAEKLERRLAKLGGAL